VARVVSGGVRRLRVLGWQAFEEAHGYAQLPPPWTWVGSRDESRRLSHLSLKLLACHPDGRLLALGASG
jgi:hypothetical protein